MKPPKKVNHKFNTWHQIPTTERPPDDSHYSITRERGTLKAEAHLERHTKPGGKMPVPPPLPTRAR